MYFHSLGFLSPLLTLCQPLYCETLIHFIVREGPHEMDHLYIAELVRFITRSSNPPALSLMKDISTDCRAQQFARHRDNTS